MRRAARREPDGVSARLSFAAGCRHNLHRAHAIHHAWRCGHNLMSLPPPIRMADVQVASGTSKAPPRNGRMIFASR
jgi:hypothetical protein